MQRKVSRESVLQQRVWKSQNPISQALRKSWGQRLSSSIRLRAGGGPGHRVTVTPHL